MKIRGACMECEYSDVIDGSSGTFSCRRYAPRPVPISSESLGERWVWPVVLPEDWCGEFLERQPNEDEEQDPPESFTTGEV